MDCFASWGAPAWLCERGAATALITVVVIVPLSLPRKVSALDRVSFSAVLFTVIFCVAVFARFVDPFPVQTRAGGSVKMFTESVSVCVCVCVCRMYHSVSRKYVYTDAPCQHHHHSVADTPLGLVTGPTRSRGLPTDRCGVQL